MKENKMFKIEIEKMVIQAGGTEDKLDRQIKLLEMITNKKVEITKAKKRIPTFGISPGKKAGCKVTLRGEKQITDLLKRFFASIDNIVKEKQINMNHFTFGIKEYIEVPGLEYDRDIGILGFEIDLSFKRKGKRVKIRKIKRARIPFKQNVTKEEIVEYLNKNFSLEVVK